MKTLFICPLDTKQFLIVTKALFVWSVRWIIWMKMSFDVRLVPKTVHSNDPSKWIIWMNLKIKAKFSNSSRWFIWMDHLNEPFLAPNEHQNSSPSRWFIWLMKRTWPDILKTLLPILLSSLHEPIFRFFLNQFI